MDFNILLEPSLSILGYMFLLGSLTLFILFYPSEKWTNFCKENYTMIVLSISLGIGIYITVNFLFYVAGLLASFIFSNYLAFYNILKMDFSKITLFSYIFSFLVPIFIFDFRYKNHLRPIEKIAIKIKDEYIKDVVIIALVSISFFIFTIFLFIGFRIIGYSILTNKLFIITAFLTAFILFFIKVLLKSFNKLDILNYFHKKLKLFTLLAIIFSILVSSILTMAFIPKSELVETDKIGYILEFVEGKNVIYKENIKQVYTIEPNFVRWLLIDSKDISFGKDGKIDCRSTRDNYFLTNITCEKDLLNNTIVYYNKNEMKNFNITIEGYTKKMDTDGVLIDSDWKNNNLKVLNINNTLDYTIVQYFPYSFAPEGHCDGYNYTLIFIKNNTEVGRRIYNLIDGESYLTEIYENDKRTVTVGGHIYCNARKPWIERIEVEPNTNVTIEFLSSDDQ